MTNVEVSVLDRRQTVYSNVSLTLVKVIWLLNEFFLLDIDRNIEFLQLFSFKFLVVETFDSDSRNLHVAIGLIFSVEVYLRFAELNHTFSGPNCRGHWPLSDVGVVRSEISTASNDSISWRISLFSVVCCAISRLNDLGAVLRFSDVGLFDGSRRQGLRMSHRTILIFPVLLSLSFILSDIWMLNIIVPVLFNSFFSSVSIFLWWSVVPLMSVADTGAHSLSNNYNISYCHHSKNKYIKALFSMCGTLIWKGTIVSVVTCSKASLWDLGSATNADFRWNVRVNARFWAEVYSGDLLIFRTCLSLLIIFWVFLNLPKAWNKLFAIQ